MLNLREKPYIRILGGRSQPRLFLFHHDVLLFCKKSNGKVV